MNKVVLKFTELSTGKTIEFPLISKYSIITGLSGSGKTQFYNYVLDEDSPFVKKECELPVVTATSGNINAIFDENNKMTRSVVFVDEILLKQYKISERLINQSNHLILSISRDIPFIGYAPLQSIFSINRDTEGWFVLSRLMDKSTLRISHLESDFDFIVTEARKDRSEHEFLSRWLDLSKVKLIAADGKDKIHRVLLQLNKNYNNPKILVFTDLSNFGLQYRLLEKRCKDNPNIVFYDYGSFEQMLFLSEFVKGHSELSPFDFITLEKFYEVVLEKYTEKLPFKYIHGKPLSECFLSECRSCEECEYFCNCKFPKIVGKDSGLLELSHNKNY